MFEDASPIEVASGLGLGWDPHAAVLGLDEGWLVAWSSPVGSAEESDIAYARVSPDGTVGAARFANEDRRGLRVRPALSRLGDDVVIAWQDESGLSAGFGRVRIEHRVLAGSSLSPRTPTSELSALGTSSREPAFASSGDVTLAVWTEEPEDFFGRPRIVGRRLGGAAPDPAPFVISELDGAEPALAALDSGDFVVAWVSRADDPRGDVRARLVHATGDPVPAPATTLAATAGQPEGAPSVLPLPGDEALVAYDDGGVRRGVGLAQLGVGALAPESIDLSGYLVDGLQGDTTLARSSRGHWFAWSDGSERFGEPAAYRSFLAFLLGVN